MPWGSCRQTWRREGCPPLPHHLVCVKKFTLPYPTSYRFSAGLVYGRQRHKIALPRTPKPNSTIKLEDTYSSDTDHPVWPKAHPAISRGVCTAQCGFFIYIDVGHEAPPCRALRAPAGRGSGGASRLRPFFAQHAIHRHRPCRQRRGFPPRALRLGRSLTASRFAH